MSKQETVDAAVALVTKEYTDKGLLIEAGWRAYQIVVLPKDAGPVQIDETRKAFFAGAQHLFASIMSVLDPDEEPTANDLRRMDLIDQELHKFAGELGLDIMKPRGRA